MAAKTTEGEAKKGAKKGAKKEEGEQPRRGGARSYTAEKEHEGKRYRGMRVGRVHRWNYPDGSWHERKMEPSRWEFSFASTKQRKNRAPKGSGAGVGSGYHWLIVAHQWVRKSDANTYATLMEGEKHLIGFRKPSWERWNTQFRNQPTARQKTIRFLRETLARLEAEEAEGRELSEAELEGLPVLEEPWQHPVFGELDIEEDAAEILEELVPEKIRASVH